MRGKSGGETGGKEKSTTRRLPAACADCIAKKVGAGDGNRNHSRRASMRVCAGLCARQAHRSAPEPLPTATNCYNLIATTARCRPRAPIVASDALRRQRKLDTAKLEDKVWFGRLRDSETPRGFRKTRDLGRRCSRIDGSPNWASISPQETCEYATSESTEPNRRGQ